MKKNLMYIIGAAVVVGGIFLMKNAVDGFDKNYQPKGYEVKVEGSNEKNEKEEMDDSEKMNEKEEMKDSEEMNDNKEMNDKQEMNDKEDMSNKEDMDNKDDMKNEMQEYNKAVDFTLKDLDGNDVSLSDFQGKKIFLNFWATWCPNCREEMPHMEELSKAYKDEVVIVAVDVGEPKKTVANYVENNNLTFKVLLDEESDIATKFGITGFPTSVLLDENGNIVYGIVGKMSYENMEKFVKGELK